MKTSNTLIALALAALFAASGATYACGPGPRAGAAANPQAQAERVQTRLAALKEALKLQPAQVEAWNAYEAKVATEAQTRAQLRAAMQEHRGDAEAIADHRVTMIKHRAEAAEEINALRKALVATLTPEQKATFEQYAMGPRFARGQGFGPGGGRSPGYGPGPGGGRGAGFGGCVGMV